MSRARIGLTAVGGSAATASAAAAIRVAAMPAGRVMDMVRFENTGADLGGGLAVTGNYPGKARTPDELRADLDKALSLIPGTHRLNLHASYAETGGKKVERTDLGPEHFARWLDWAKAKGMGLDFNPTF